MEDISDWLRREFQWLVFEGRELIRAQEVFLSMCCSSLQILQSWWTVQFKLFTFRLGRRFPFGKRYPSCEAFISDLVPLLLRFITVNAGELCPCVVTTCARILHLFHDVTSEDGISTSIYFRVTVY
jgi:hypothetical protein